MITLEPSGVDELLFADTLKALNPDTAQHPQNYDDCVIVKPWGVEFRCSMTRSIRSGC